jgi:hypothetical protein
MEAISFSEQAPAARRDYFAGSNSGVVGDVVEKFTGDPPPGVPAVPPAAERHRRSGAPGCGASIFKMMDVSRHKSVDTLRGYARDAELFKDHAGAGLL